jgi:tetratricopeptide (TPR) repeat protein
MTSDPTPLPPPARAGTVLGGRYRLVEPLGRGGMGEVWRARDAQLERDVAAKLPRAADLDEGARARLLREARLVASLQHPGVVSVFDTGESEGQSFVIFELVPGRNLREQPAHGEEEVRAVAAQVLDALAHVHANGIVHRDLKPENLIWSDGETGSRVKIADLGIAFSGSSTTLAAGSLVGTAAYLAPEQALGGAVDGRADLYALGVVLYELLAGRPPFEGADVLAVVSQHVHAPVPPLRLHVPDVAPALESYVLRLLEKSPEQRFAGATEALAALQAIDPAGGDAAAGAAPVSAIDHLVRGRLVGRTAELERLRAAWSEALGGRAQLVLLSGEPGVGKTRLARELMVAARVDGALVLGGGCYEFEATTPYLPFVEMLSTWARERATEPLRVALGDAAPELARLVPEIDARLGPFPPVQALQPHEERLRLFEAVTRFLRALAARRGLLLLLDDLHWADTGTLALVRHLLRQMRGDRVLLLGTYREIELDRRHPLAAALVEWDRERISTRVALGRLSREDSSALLATLLRQESVTEEFGDALHRETEGNPFFVEEVVKALIEQGQIYRENGEWQRLEVGELAIPQSVKAAIGHRLDRLGEACTAVLHVAAVLGKVFEFPVLAACAGGGEDALLDALDEAAAAQLVAPLERESFSFTHDKIREVLIEELNPIRLRRLHLRIAEVLAARPDARPQDLSYHYLEAGELEPALRWSLAAAGRASEVYALPEAASHLERAKECAEALGDSARRLEVILALALLHAQRGDSPAAIATARSGLSLCSSPEQRLRLLMVAAESAVQVAHADAEALIDAAEADLPPDAESLERGILLTLRGRVHHYRAEHSRAAELYERALSLPVLATDPGAHSRALAFMAGNLQHVMRLEESMEYAQRCIELGQRCSQPAIEGIGHEFAAEDLNLLGRYAEARRHAEADLRLGEKAGSLDRQGWARFCLSWTLHELGELESSIAESRRLLEICETVGEHRLLAFGTSVAAEVSALLGLDDDHREWLARGNERIPALKQVNLSSFWANTRGRIALDRGDAAGALALMREALALRADTQNNVGMERVLPDAALAAARVGELGAAQEHADAAEAFAARCGAVAGRPTILRARAALSLARRRPDEAVALLTQAIAVADANGQRLDRVRALADRAAVARTMNRVAEADADLAAARELASACGAVLLLERLG